MTRVPTEQEQEFEAMLAKAIESNQPFEPMLTFRHGGQEELEAMLADAINTPLIPESNMGPSYHWCEVVDEAQAVLANGSITNSDYEGPVLEVDEPATLEQVTDFVEVVAACQDEWVKRQLQGLDAKLRDDMFRIVQMITMVQKKKEADMQERIRVLEAENEHIISFILRMEENLKAQSSSSSTGSPESSSRHSGAQQ